jgi:hypothetical protein
MATSNYFEKVVDGVKDYYVDWSAWLDGDTIVTSTWTVPDGITKDSDTNTGTRAEVWLSGGTLDTYYTLVNHITTAAGRHNDQPIVIRII